MNLICKRVRGMQDLLPHQSDAWTHVTNVMKKEASLCGFKTMRTPILEHTELFKRSSGETSDIVKKEMYTFEDKSSRSLTLRPEGTAGTLRAVLENGLHNGVLPLKVMYESACYRYEKPQSGRFREFFQFGLEIFGASSVIADFELISIAYNIIKNLGIKDVTLEINSIGCKICREASKEKLRAELTPKINFLCADCKERINTNIMRIFDCKIEKCKKIFSGLENICKKCTNCNNDYEKLKELLRFVGIEFIENPCIVRGLDYYNGNVFEFVHTGQNQPITICGGGRYDGLSKQIGGCELPAIGCGFGLERLLMLMEAQEIKLPANSSCDVYIANVGEESRKKVLELAKKLRKFGLIVQIDILCKNTKSQVKFADKIGAKFCIFVGNDELNSESLKIKNMKTGEDFDVKLDENFENYILNLVKSTI